MKPPTVACRRHLGTAAAAGPGRSRTPHVRSVPLIATAACNGLIYALNAQGRHTEAEALACDALVVHRVPDRFALVLRLGLARSLNGQARHQEALAEAERANELRHGLREEQCRPGGGSSRSGVAARRGRVGPRCACRPDGRGRLPLR
jgi:hypothetical protein